MANGSLERWLHPGQEPRDELAEFRNLNLLQIFNIAIDVASAFQYLHNDCEITVIHCDPKPSNILLDDDMIAHLCDFGLARLLQELRNPNLSSSIGVKGTIVYGVGSQVSTEGDVYCCGIVLLEMMTGKRPNDHMFENGLSLHKYAKTAFPDQLMEIVDVKLLLNSNGKTNTSHMECIATMVKIGLACLVELPQDRINVKDALTDIRLAKDILLGVRS
ncbi:hypothetical protein Ancab_020790 [Ancistrocladus abbreviatus]